MTKIQVNKFTEILRARQAELKASTRKRDDIAIERTPDMLDEVQFAAERELVTRSLERESMLSREVRAALARIDEGTYGVCVHCDEEIGTKRLNALPWTPLCIRCQEESDGARFVEIEPREYLRAA